MALRDRLRRIQFQGSLRTAGDKAAPVWMTAEYEEYDPSHIDIRLNFLGDDSQQKEAAGQLRNLHYDYLSIEPSDGFFGKIEAFGLRKLSWSTDTASTRPELVQYGIEYTPAKEIGEYHFSVQLRPSNILGAGGIVRCRTKAQSRLST